MNTINSELRSGLPGRFFWTLSFKNRQILIPTLIVLILVGAVFLVQKYIAMEMQLKKLSHYEPIYVLTVNKDLNIGDVIKLEDLAPMIFYKREYERLNYTEPGSNVSIPSFIKCQYEPDTKVPSNSKLSGFDDVVGRVLKLPVHANSMLRREYFAPRGTVPGLINLIDKKHTLLDVEVAQSGFNVFVKPSDQVDLYELTKDGSRLLASKVKVILVDSLALGQAPLQVAVSPRSSRHLTLSIPEELYSTVARAKLNKSLIVTYKNKEAEQIIVSNMIHRVTPRAKITKSENLFQPLVLIQGTKKEVLGQ